MRPDRFFRYSALDVLPALCAIGHVALLIGTFALFHRLPAWLLGPAFCLIVFNYCWNVQSISHNFIHNGVSASTRRSLETRLVDKCKHSEVTR